MWTIQFWKDLLERALKSAAQALVLVLGGATLDVWHLDWKMLVSVILSAFGLSALTSITSNVLPTGNPGTASMTKAVELSDHNGTELSDHNGTVS